VSIDVAKDKLDGLYGGTLTTLRETMCVGVGGKASP